ncbi:hypothetical protein [Nocardia nova]|uniref:hypothetical protein n=1 Tax=Nocardia nova TaxID=37330 RepID=UPI0033D478D5
MDTNDTDDVLGWNIDDAAQYDPEWSVWALDDTIAAKVDALFTTTLPSVPQRPWWHDQGLGSDDDVWVPMPDYDRYDMKMLDWVGSMAWGWFFPDRQAFESPVKREVADQFVAYIARTFEVRLDATLLNSPGMGHPLYKFGPTAAMEFAPDLEHLVIVLGEAASGGFDHVTTKLFLLGIEKERA